MKLESGYYKSGYDCCKSSLCLDHILLPPLTTTASRAP